MTRVPAGASRWRAGRFVLDDRGTTRELDAFVVAAAWAGDTPAFALGDGRLVMDWQDIAAHDGAILALAASRTASSPAATTACSAAQPRRARPPRSPASA